MIDQITEIENEYISIYTENGIIIGEIKKNVYIDLKAAKIIAHDRKRISNYQDSLIFLDSSQIKGISKEARDFFASKEGSEYIVANAIYSNSKLSFFLTNFLIKVNFGKTNIPVKSFRNKKKAITWLLKHK